MSRTNVAVDAALAEDLSAQAVAQKKTLFGLTNEVVQSALRVLHEGGSASETYWAWKVLRISREVGGMPLLPRNLVEELVQRLHASDKEWLLRTWYEKGVRMGEHMRMLYTNPDELATAVEELRGALSAQRIELRRGTSREDGRARLVVRIVADLSQPLTECVERFVVGLLFSYSYRPEESRITQGILEITAVRETGPTESTRSSEGNPEGSTNPPNG